MPVLNPRTNFRYSQEQSSLNGILEMVPMPPCHQMKQMTIEETLAAINNSAILHQFTSSTQTFICDAVPDQANSSIDKGLKAPIVESPRHTYRALSGAKSSTPRHKPPLQQSQVQSPVPKDYGSEGGAAAVRGSAKERIDLELCRAQLNEEK